MTQPKIQPEIHFHIFSGQSPNSSAHNKGIIPFIQLSTLGYELRSAENFQIHPNETITTYLNIQIQKFPSNHYATIVPNNELYPQHTYHLIKTILNPPEDFEDIKISIKNDGKNKIFINREDLIAFLFIHKCVDISTTITLTPSPIPSNDIYNRMNTQQQQLVDNELQTTISNKTDVEHFLMDEDDNESTYSSEY
eukprot:457194_1